MYAKLFQQVLYSSLTEKEPLDVRGLFFMLMAAADKNGHVMGSDTTIARLVNVPMEQFSRCLEALLQPDPHSKNQDFEGRRVVRLERGLGLFLPSYPSYSGIKTDAERREYFRLKKAESRERQKEEANGEKIPEKTRDFEMARPVISYLNEKTGKRFRENENNAAIISARLKERDVTTEGVLKMIDRQVKRWKDDPRMAEYLRIKTLFGPENFENYYAAKDLEVLVQTAPNGTVSLKQQIDSTKALYDECSRRLDKIKVPEGDWNDAERKAALEKRKPLVEEKHQLAEKLNRLHKQAAGV